MYNNKLNDVELNAILYYADYLSLQAISIPVTHTCKYFFIHNSPINAAYLTKAKNWYNDSIYFQKSLQAYELIRDKFDQDGVDSFIDSICNIQACGMVDGDRMLTYIHQFSDKKSRLLAFEKYHNYKQKFTHTTFNDDGDKQITECSKYIYHTEK